MDSILKSQFRTAIDSKKENNFQEFINELFIKRYGTAFTPVKQKHDKGCDGILNQKTIIAGYAPPNPDLKTFGKKIADDFKKYQENWQKQHPEWCLVYNGELTGAMLQKLQLLQAGTQPIDINGLLNIVEELPYSKRREVASFLGINEQYLVNDVMKTVVEDFLKTVDGSLAGHNSYTPPPYIEDKIKINYDAADIDAALEEYASVAEYFNYLKDVLKSYQDFEITALKVKLIGCYNKYSGNFKTRLSYLVSEFSERNKNDDYYAFFVKTVLVYFFETCIIGKKPVSEQK